MAKVLNENDSFKAFIGAERARDRYKRLQKQCNKKNKKDSMMSGIPGEASEAHRIAEHDV